MNQYLGIIIEILLFIIYTRRLPGKRQINGGVIGFLLVIYLLVRYAVVGDGMWIIPVRLIFAALLIRLLCQVPLQGAGFMGILFSFLLHIVVTYYSVCPLPWTVIEGQDISLSWQLVTAGTQLLLILLFRRNLAETKGMYLGFSEVLLLGFSYALFNDVVGQVTELYAQEEAMKQTSVLFICVASVIVLMAAVWRMAYRTKNEEAREMETLLKSQYEEWVQKRERDETIRRMYHDLKHHLLAIAASDSQVAQNVSEALQESLGQYHIVPESGNAILDTIFNEKARECRKKDITFHLLEQIDQIKELDFINSMDLCAIFGNALDNAIEAASQIPEKESRYVHLKLIKRDMLLKIAVENNYQGERIVKTDLKKLPETTKADKKHHGIGLSSIRYAVSQYGGTMKISAEEGVFTLKIIIPCPEHRNRKLE